MKSGIWDPLTLSPNISVLHKFPFYEGFEGNNSVGVECLPSLEAILASFDSTHLSLLRDADMEDEGTVRIYIRQGAHLTSDAVIEALFLRDTRRSAVPEAVMRREGQRL